MVDHNARDRIALHIVDEQRNTGVVLQRGLRHGDGGLFQQLLLLFGGADAHRRAEHQTGEKNGGEFWFDGHIEYLP